MESMFDSFILYVDAHPPLGALVAIVSMSLIGIFFHAFLCWIEERYEKWKS